ncbi:MAG TPA: SRPBCC domain-containing protein [Acidimicrobiia bacterium]|nr:SRPBCC domain-containing protein [Acidimicrobiia bacterium]
MTETGHGHLDRRPEGVSVHFERVLAAPADEVWELLATADGLERWLARATVDLGPGGVVDLDFGDDGIGGGDLIEVVPGATLEYHWRFTGEPDSVVRFELEPIDAVTTRLRLHHTLLPDSQATGYGAGWHSHLDQLEALIDGRDPIDWGARFTELLPHYRERVT